MNTFFRRLPCALAAACLATAFPLPATADDASIRKSIAEHYPEFPKIDEISKTPVAGLYEIRFGSDVMYIDENGGTIFQGHLVEARTRTDITEQRVEKLTAIDFKTLPLKDAMVWKNGNGSRKLVVFADPNCGYCKRFENDLLKVKDLTVYTFLYPILGGDSPEKSEAIWCAKDKAKVWRDWMINGTPVARSNGPCDASVIKRNAALGKQHRINGTPGLVFEDGKKLAGAIDAGEIERQLSLASGHVVVTR